MKKKILIALLAGYFLNSYSQNDHSKDFSKNFSKDYSFVYENDSIIKKGISLYENEKYEESIKEYEKIDHNDPKYLNAQYEKALALYSLKKNEAFEKLMEDLRQKKLLSEAPNLYTLYGNYLSDAKRFEEAEKLFLEGEQYLSNSSNFLFNFAILYIRKEETQKSIDLLKKVVTINPNHASSHYFLGLLALDNGNVTEATLALTSYLTLAPTGKYASEAIVKLNEKFGESYLEKGKMVFSKSGDNFEEIDVILRNQLPLKKAYKVRSDFDDVVIRQIQAVVDYSLEHKMGDGFFETTYMPWIKDLAQKKQFEGLSYYILLSLEEKLGKKLTSHKKEIISFNEKYIDVDFWKKFATRKIEHFGETKEVLILMKDNDPYIVGSFIGDKKEGKFKLLNEFGKITGELNFKNDLGEGVQKYFDDKGNLIEEKTLVNGKLEGKKTEYYSNGNVSSIENYKNDELEGLSSNYYMNGGKECELNFNAGKENGKLTCHYSNGTIKSLITYTDGKLNGPYIKYNEIGDITEETTYTNGELNGKHTVYFGNKSIKSETTYVNGKASDISKQYYANGNVEEESFYQNGELVKDKEFYPTGKKSKESIYSDKGTIQLSSYFDENENKYFEGKYVKDELKSGMQFTGSNPKPAPVSIAKKPFQIKNFTGDVIIIGEYEKGLKNKTWEQRYSNGVVKFRETYNKGVQEGLTHSYNRDGSLNYIANYANNAINGSYESYDYGVKEEEFYIKDGAKNGPFKSYYSDGSLASEGYYVNDQLNYNKQEYWLNGKFSDKSTFMDGEIVKLERFNPNGELEGTIDFKNLNGKLSIKRSNGTVTENYEMINGEYNGKYIEKDKENTPILETEFINGARHNNCKYYGPLGKLIFEKPYYAGLLHGLSKYYDLAGNLMMTDEYVYGEEFGKTIRYFQNQGKMYEYSQLDNLMEGEQTYYNLKGEPLLIIGYQNNIAKYYIKKDKEGKLTDKTVIKNETAEMTSYYPNGKLAITTNLNKGNTEGKFIINNAEGKPEMTAVYKNNYADGERVQYHANGKIYKIERLKNGNYEGLQEYFSENGNPLLSAMYKDNRLHGDVLLYKDNKLAVTKKYNTNELVEIIK